MARKKKHPEHVNHERWLVSYADFITLLFAFFVVMFAVSQVDSKKVGRFTESFSKAVGVDIFPQPGKGIMPGVSNGIPSEADPSSTSALPAELDTLQVSLTKSDAGEPPPPAGVQVLRRRNELVLRLADGLLFDSGNDTLREPAIHVLQRIAMELKKRNVDVRVEGHTDPRPIRTGRFHSNWDLSTARATAVVARLAMEGLSPKNLSAAGYGEFHPVAKNDTAEGMAKNRRVDLIVSVAAKDAVEVTLKEATAEKSDKDVAPKKGKDDGEKPEPAKKPEEEEEAPKPVAKNGHGKELEEKKSAKDDEQKSDAEAPHSTKPSHEEHKE